MIEIRSVSFQYDDTPILKDLSLTVNRGDTAAIMGANGAGKTTLLRLIAGLIEQDEGRIDIATEGSPTDSRQESVATRTDRDPVVGFAPENPDDALFAGSVQEEVGFFPRNRDLPVEERVSSTLEKLGIEEYKSRTPQTLSQGEKRLVSLAAVLSGDPDIIALDEPTSGLDIPAMNRLIERIHEIDRTVVLATHDSEFAWRVADSVIVLDGGQIQRQGSVRAIMVDEALDFGGLGLREPGPVRWAREHGFEDIPESPSQAAKWLGQEDKE